MRASPLEGMPLQRAPAALGRHRDKAQRPASRQPPGRAARTAARAEAAGLTGVGARQRQCASCWQTKDTAGFLREPIEPFQFQRECRECAFSLPLAHPSEAGLPEGVRRQRERARRLEADFQATSGQARYEATMAHLDQCAERAREAAAQLTAQRLRDPGFFEERLLGVQRVMSLSRGDTILLIRDQKDLLLLAPDLLAQRLLELRLAVPKANVSRLVQIGPWLLLMDDVGGQLRPVLRQLQAVMPSFDVEAKLHEGTGVWWTAADMLRSQGRRFSYA